MTKLLFMEELIAGQQKKMEACAARIIPGLTSDDLLQPNDFPQLELHPHFRYEEGILDGLRMAYTALAVQVALPSYSEENPSL